MEILINIVLIFGGILLARWVFETKKSLSYQRKSYQLLKEIAKAQGVSENQIKFIDQSDWKKSV